MQIWLVKKGRLDKLFPRVRRQLEATIRAEEAKKIREVKKRTGETNKKLEDFKKVSTQRIQRAFANVEINLRRLRSSRKVTNKVKFIKNVLEVLSHSLSAKISPLTLSFIIEEQLRVEKTRLRRLIKHLRNRKETRLTSTIPQLNSPINKRRVKVVMEKAKIIIKGGKKILVFSLKKFFKGKVIRKRSIHFWKDGQRDRLAIITKFRKLLLLQFFRKHGYNFPILTARGTSANSRVFVDSRTRLLNQKRTLALSVFRQTRSDVSFRNRYY